MTAVDPLGETPKPNGKGSPPDALYETLRERGLACCRRVSPQELTGAASPHCLLNALNPIPPKKSPSLREAVRMIAILGGFLGRKSDGEPGS